MDHRRMGLAALALEAARTVLGAVRRGLLMRQATMAVAPVVAALVVGCAPRHEPALPVAASPPACRDLADGYGRPVSAELRWHAPSDTTDQRLTAWCGTVGPGVFHPARQSASSPTSN